MASGFVNPTDVICGEILKKIAPNLAHKFHLLAGEIARSL